MMPKLCDLVFIFKTCSDQIWAKLINQEVVAALFSSRCRKTLQNEKIFLYLEIAEIDMGEGQFWVEKNDSGHKNSFLKVKHVFWG